jgi:hypothetical protein
MTIRHASAVRRATLVATLLVVASAISGCVSGSGQRSELVSAPVCCSSMREFRFEDLPLDKPVSLSIEKSTHQAFEFPQGKSLFAAFRLPPASGPLSLEFTMGSNSPWVPSVKIFVPTFLFLDRESQPIGEPFTVGLLRQGQVHEGMPRFIGGISWSGDVDVPTGASAVVIYTDPAQIGHTRSYYEIPSEARHDAIIGAEGALKIRVRTVPSRPL